MKETIRDNVFETNSSTSHSLVILSEENYNKWAEGDLYLYLGDKWFEKELRKSGVPEDKIPKVDHFYTKDEVIERLILAGYIKNIEEMDEDEFEECLLESTRDNNFYTFGGWNGDSEYSLEEDTYYHTSEHGDKLAIRAKYGYDG